MWDLTICGVDFYHIINWFFIYSFFGWVWETGYVSVKNGKYVNRGFINGPLCTIYGCGAVSVYLILKPVSDNLLFLFLGGIVVATTLEYVTAVLMESIFHTSWWDYSDQKFNFQGRICLGASIGWGFFSVALFKVLHPLVEAIVRLYPVYVGEIMVCVISVGYVIDFCYSAAAAFHIHERITVLEQNLEQAREELLVKMQERLRNSMSVPVESTIESMRERLKDVEFIKEMEEKRTALMAELNAELEIRRHAAASRFDHNMKRFMKSYPNLNRGYKLHRKRHEERKSDK